MPRNPYVFVCGGSRSGSALLQRMLDSHRQLAVSNDTHVVPRTLLRLDPPDLDLALTDDLLQEVVGFKPFDRLGIDPETARPELVGSGILGDAPGSVDQLADGFAQVLDDSALRRDLAACAAVRGAGLVWTVFAPRIVRFASGSAGNEADDTVPKAAGAS